MAIENYTPFALAMCVYVAIPGPGVMAVVARALASGMRATLPHIAGILLGNMIYLLTSLFGLAWLAQSMGEAFFIIKLAGGLYLVWLGARLWRKNEAMQELEARQSKGIMATFLTGLMITLSNPKAILFYLAALPAVLHIGRLDPASLAPVMLINSLVLIVIIGAYAAMASRLRAIFSQGRALRRLNRGAGSIMIAAGLGVASS
jgi:threonine/homoserine/homoserine lactone efflux protein